MADIQYRVMIDDWAGHDLNTSFVHAAPEWLFQVFGEVYNLPRFLDILRDTHHDHILKGTPWRCQGCPKEATEVISKPLCLWPQRTIVNRLVPICQSGGPCEKVGKDHLEAMMQQMDRDMKRTTGQCLYSVISGRHLQLCRNCHEETHLKACGRCKKISYCSKECQQQHWKKHKHDCTPSSSCAV